MVEIFTGEAQGFDINNEIFILTLIFL